jgi:hypothetical protein
MTLNIEKVIKNINRTITTLAAEGSELNGSAVVDRMMKDGMLARYQYGSTRYQQLRSLAAEWLAKRARNLQRDTSSQYRQPEWQPPRSEQPGQYLDHGRDNQHQHAEPTTVIGFTEDDLVWRR